MPEITLLVLLFENQKVKQKGPVAVGNISVGSCAQSHAASGAKCPRLIILRVNVREGINDDKNFIETEALTYASHSSRAIRAAHQGVLRQRQPMRCSYRMRNPMPMRMTPPTISTFFLKIVPNRFPMVIPAVERSNVVTPITIAGNQIET